MCDPVSIAGLALAAVGTAAQARMGALNAQRMGEASNAAAVANNNALTEREKQINASSADQQNQRTRQAMVERARLQNSGAGSGLEDNTGRNMLETFFNQSADIASIEANRSNSIKQTELQKQGVAAQALGGFNDALNHSPSMIDAGLKIGGAGLYYGDKAGAFTSTPQAPAYGPSAEDLAANPKNKGFIH